MRNRRYRTFITGYTIAVIVLSVFFCYTQPSLLERIEERLYDLRCRAFRGTTTPSGRIAIVAIDDRSIAELGRFPWSRSENARLVDQAAKAGARAVLFDVVFPESESAEADGRFAESMRRFGRVTLATAFDVAPDGKSLVKVVNIPVLAGAARREAHINILPDDDGVLRWSRLLVEYEGRFFPSMGLAAAMDALGADDFKPAGSSVVVGPVTVPTTSTGYRTRYRYLITYSGGPGTFKRYSFADVAAGRLPPGELAGKVLLVGSTALAVYDMRVTPYSNNSPGVEVNANVAESILQRNFIQRGTVEALIDLLAIVVIAMVVALSAAGLRAGAAFPIAVSMMGLFAALASALFSRGMWVSLVYPLFAGGLVYAGVSYFRFMLLDRRAREIRTIFSSYVSRKLVEQLVANPELARVGGEIRVITVVFSDVKNYTSYSEGRTPQEVVKILNEYLAAMTAVIMDHDGTLDKFLGDGILAFWGAPVPQEKHAELAVRCVLAMIERLGELQKKWTAEGSEPLSFGVGINTGEVIVGNIGAEGLKMEYTVIGDNVNLTYRIQNESREHDCPAMTESTWELVKDIVEADLIGPVTVKGKTRPVVIYGLRGLKR